MNEALPPALLEASSDRFSTHRVLNQALPANSFNAFTSEAVLRAAIGREAAWAAERCAALGAVAIAASFSYRSRPAPRSSRSVP